MMMMMRVCVSERQWETPVGCVESSRAESSRVEGVVRFGSVRTRARESSVVVDGTRARARFVSFHALERRLFEGSLTRIGRTTLGVDERTNERTVRSGRRDAMAREAMGKVRRERVRVGVHTRAPTNG